LLVCYPNRATLLFVNIAMRQLLNPNATGKPLSVNKVPTP
jgi:hypothetical protein